ncbi:hypothetical protein BD626DRAFT_410891 [Schizophyllum amplum]|uniref:MYND-type domain-containing protein n=1 Tax=Schizophyllum amplum TaxID=97359 RepID=A0A550C077_9AGAR|nr:hypothetical protein BD626DRAFT_410891 [Auriculariopsis ampla]
MKIRRCSVCRAKENVKRCSHCKKRYYCSQRCQTADWPIHRAACPPYIWYNSDKYRKCQDGNLHEGDLELITWDAERPDKDTGDLLGWGACVKEESEDLKRKYYEEFKGNDRKMFKYWPQGYRWTCCGMPGDMPWGCDHHGTGSKPCTCDYCGAGKQLPLRIYNDPAQSRMGLKLSRGPDPRSRRPGAMYGMF